MVNQPLQPVRLMNQGIGAEHQQIIATRLSGGVILGSCLAASRGQEKIRSLSLPSHSSP